MADACKKLTPHCYYCDKELSKEKGEVAHGCLDCHQTPQVERINARDLKIKELQTKLEEFKVFGTDECNQCVDEFGHTPVGGNYNRMTLFYKPLEHDDHKRRRMKSDRSE